MTTLNDLKSDFTNEEKVITFSQFSILGCDNLQVILKNDVLIKQGSLQGTYQKAQWINRKSSWKTSSRAVWFIPEYSIWVIGKLENIGTSYYEIAFTSNQGTKVETEA